jgi:hypothetical protein
MTLRPLEEILALEGIERLDAIAEEMWGPPRPVSVLGGKAVRTPENHNARLAELAGCTARRMRQVRAAGIVPRKMMNTIVDRWRLWRVEQGRGRKRRAA